VLYRQFDRLIGVPRRGITLTSVLSLELRRGTGVCRGAQPLCRKPEGVPQKTLYYFLLGRGVEMVDQDKKDLGRS
jgi:adenine/guanine phosphoribosyltransferase-like PRPP-binding protein